MKIKLDKTMFREYDIRGLVNSKQLNNESVTLITKGVASFLQKKGIKKVCVGFDSRKSSPEFHEIVVKNLLACGLDVVDIGMVLVPMFYFAQYEYMCPGGIYISASHNPSDWNGFKIADNYSSTILGKQMDELYQLIINKDFTRGKGELSVKDVLPSYSANLLKRKMGRTLTVVIDGGNATPGKIVPEIFKKAGLKVIPLYCNLNANFPNHEPNPSAPENKKDLAELVIKSHADLGLAFDTDGDRLGVVDEKGNIIEADQFLILLARSVLEEKPNSKIIFDVKCTQALVDDIKNHHGIPIMWKTGHSYIKAKMREEKAPLGGEVSGHIFFAENRGFDDAVFAAYKLCSFLSSQKYSFSKIMETVPKYISTSTLNADCGDKIKYKIAQQLTEDFKKEYQVIDINGVRVLFENGWGLVRPSSNLPVLVLRFEAKTQKGLEYIMDVFKNKMSKYPQIGKEWYHG